MFTCWIDFQDNIIFDPNDSTQLLSTSEKHVLIYSRVSPIFLFIWMHDTAVVSIFIATAAFFQALGSLQYFALKLKEVNIIIEPFMAFLVNIYATVLTQPSPDTY